MACLPINRVSRVRFFLSLEIIKSRVFEVEISRYLFQVFIFLHRIYSQAVEASGLPAGLVNVLPCSRDQTAEVGAALCSSDTIRVISFTGSTEVGKVPLL